MATNVKPTLTGMTPVPMHKVDFTVTDGDGKNIKDATITFGAFSVTTNGGGKATQNGVSNGDYTATANAAGFLTVTKDFTVSGTDGADVSVSLV